VRDLQLYLNPHAEHLLDWFHVAMRLTVLQQTAKGLPDKTRDEEEDYPLRDPIVRDLERLKRSSTRILRTTRASFPIMASDIDTANGSAPVLWNRR
jgi:hypothetical protein